MPTASRNYPGCISKRSMSEKVCSSTEEALPGFEQRGQVECLNFIP